MRATYFEAFMRRDMGRDDQYRRARMHILTVKQMISHPSAAGRRTRVRRRAVVPCWSRVVVWVRRDKSHNGSVWSKGASLDPFSNKCHHHGTLEKTRTVPAREDFAPAPVGSFPSCDHSLALPCRVAAGMADGKKKRPRKVSVGSSSYQGQL